MSNTSKAIEHMTKLEEVVVGIKDDYRKLKSKLIELDQDISSFYHRLEHENFNAVEGFYRAKEIQELYRKRRVVKQEIYDLNRVNDHIVPNLPNHTRVMNTSKKLKESFKDSLEYRKDWKYQVDVNELLV